MRILKTIGSWIAGRRACYGPLSVPRKAAVVGLTFALALVVVAAMRAVGFGQASVFEPAAAGIILGSVLGFGVLAFAGVLSNRRRGDP